jgi:hypothetical protein
LPAVGRLLLRLPRYVRNRVGFDVWMIVWFA